MLTQRERDGIRHILELLQEDAIRKLAFSLTRNEIPVGTVQGTCQLIDLFHLPSDLYRYRSSHSDI